MERGGEKRVKVPFQMYTYAIAVAFLFKFFQSFSKNINFQQKPHPPYNATVFSMMSIRARLRALAPRISFTNLSTSSRRVLCRMRLSPWIFWCLRSRSRMGRNCVSRWWIICTVSRGGIFGSADSSRGIVSARRMGQKLKSTKKQKSIQTSPT